MQFHFQDQMDIYFDIFQNSSGARGSRPYFDKLSTIWILKCSISFFRFTSIAGKKLLHAYYQATNVILPITCDFDYIHQKIRHKKPSPEKVQTRVRVSLTCGWVGAISET
jgi:hypothetical protein